MSMWMRCCCKKIHTYIKGISNLIRLCVVRRTGAFSRAGAAGAPPCTGTDVRGMSDADAISYLNRTAVPVIGNELLRNQLSSSLDLCTTPNGHALAQGA